MERTLISAIKRSGKELLNYFNKPLKFRIKESQSSIVTMADLKSDSLIVNMIRNQYPVHNIISEESGFINNNSEYTWVIDPLDGTSNFASSLPWFGTLITLFEDSEPYMAAAYLPARDLLYFARKGRGAYKNGTHLKMKKQISLGNSLCAFSIDFTPDEHQLDIQMTIFRNIVKASRNIRSTNSLVDFLYVAEGNFGACINLNTRIWDISGLDLIINEAGGLLSDISGRRIQYYLDEESMERNYAVMAGPEEIIEELAGILRQ